jgi:hypothetical protein
MVRILICPAQSGKPCQDWFAALPGKGDFAILLLPRFTALGSKNGSRRVSHSGQKSSADSASNQASAAARPVYT